MGIQYRMVEDQQENIRLLLLQHVQTNNINSVLLSGTLEVAYLARNLI